MASPAETLQSLNSAREIVLRDPSLYPQVVPGVLQVIAPAANLELRRWGADFLAETFASQVVTADQKQLLSGLVLDTLHGYLDRKDVMGEDEDSCVVKSAVQCAASIYPFVFKSTASASTTSEPWMKMAKIKSGVLRRMDAATPGVRICCIKFVACVVLTQTPGFIADPRRPEQNETSLALVPRDHPIIPPANLEAEASGLLDRLLEVLQDHRQDALIVTATLNSLSNLVHKRATISNKILNAILSSDPLKSIDSIALRGRDKVAIISITRTTMSFLSNCQKRNTNGVLGARIQQQVDRLKHGLADALSNTPQLKRSAPEELSNGLDDNKRPRLSAQTDRDNPHSGDATQDTMRTSGPTSLAQIWTISDDQQSSTFHVERLPAPVVTQLIPALFASIPQERIDEVVNIVRSRWVNQVRKRPEAGTEEEDDDDYDPSLSFAGDGENVDDALQHNIPGTYATDLAIGPFHLPPPQPLMPEERDEYGRVTLLRMLSTLSEVEKEVKAKTGSLNAELNFSMIAPVATSGLDRFGWLSLLARLATRAPFDLDTSNDSNVVSAKPNAGNLDLAIREALLNYVMENFRGRIDVAITWLNEEWYADKLLLEHHGLDEDDGANGADDEDPEPSSLHNYWHWTLRVLDAMTPYIDVKDGKLLIRFLSEIPYINAAILNRVKKIAEDPERVQLTTNALLYLIMFRPPVRQLAVDCAEAMYLENRDAKAAAKKILTKWRPTAVEHEAAANIKAES